MKPFTLGYLTGAVSGGANGADGPGTTGTPITGLSDPPDLALCKERVDPLIVP